MDPVATRIARKMYATEPDPFTARDDAGRELYYAEGWDGWEELPNRLREDWRRVAAGEPLTTAREAWRLSP